jgi:putative endonuclease
VESRAVLGREGESIACDLYLRSGYQIVERNFRCDLGELDVVARRGDLIVFCEVKSRRSDRWGNPAEAVGALKQLRIRKLAGRWLADRRVRAKDIRFDVVSVVFESGGTRVDHYPGAF